MLARPAVALALAEALDRLTAAKVAAAQPAQPKEAVGLQAIQVAVPVLSRTTTISMERPLLHRHQSAATMPTRPGVERGLEGRLMAHPAPAPLVAEQVRRVALRLPEPGQEAPLALIPPVLVRVRLARARRRAVLEQRVAALRVRGKVLQVAP